MTTFREPESYDYQEQETPEVVTTDPTIWKLFGPDGQVLRTYSDRPTIGFHHPTD